MVKKKLFLLIPYLILFAECTPEDVNKSPVTIEVTPNNVVVAHRGAWKKKNLPQNSIASLREAIRLGCKGSEFDIVLTADDSLVVSHDGIYNNLDIQNAKYADLIDLELFNGEKLPTFREYILAGKQNNKKIKLICELKNYGLNAKRKREFASITEKTIDDLNAQENIVFISFDYNILKQLRILNPVINIQYLNGDISPEQLKLDNISGTDYNISVYKSHEDWIASAVKNNLILGVWIVNTSDDMDYFLKNKFDFITTDEPELLLSKQQ